MLSDPINLIEPSAFVGCVKSIIIIIEFQKRLQSMEQLFAERHSIAR